MIFKINSVNICVCFININIFYLCICYLQAADIENEQRKRLEEAASQVKMKSSTENLVAKTKINEKQQQVRQIYCNYLNPLQNPLNE